MTTRPSLTLPILSRYFAAVKTLKEYLNDIIHSDSRVNKRAPFELQADDSPLYNDLLNGSYVGLRQNDDAATKFYAVEPIVDMREVIDKAQEKIFQFKSPLNVLVLGYRKSQRDVKQGTTRSGVSNYFVNTLVTALQGPEWETLLQRIGDDTMLHLLSETSIFISLPNDCLCQLTGDSITYLTPKEAGPTQIPEHRSLKRQRSDTDEADHPEVKRRKLQVPSNNKALRATIKVQSPVEVIFSRSMMFYARPRRVPKTNLIVVGLPENHILNIVKSSFLKPPPVDPLTHIEPNPLELQDQARHLAKYVFARQYGLSSPFASIAPTRNMYGLRPDYSDREAEIKGIGARKTPKRIKHILVLLESMVWRHGKCAYKPLRDKVCPSKLKSTGDKDLDASIILEAMSEQSSYIQSQAFLDISTNSTLPLGGTLAEQHVKLKPKFAEFTCPLVEVWRYVCLVTQIVIPKAFWGSVKNFKLIMDYVKEYIQCRRFEEISLHHILQGFSIADCNWVATPSSAKASRVPVSDALKRRELVEDFLFWYFDSFVYGLLKTNFYITEASAFKNRLLYFRQDDWESLCSPLIERLAATTFTKIPKSAAEELLRQRKLGYSFVRLLPKETGVRPIVNLRRRQTVEKGGKTTEQSINQILQAAFHILAYEKQHQPERIGAAIFTPEAIHPKLKDFKSRIQCPDGTLPKIYFAKVDVQACFDSIEQGKLLEILRELISEEGYLLQRFGKIGLSSGRIKRTYLKKAFPEDDHPHFLQSAAQLASALRSTIFIDQVVYHFSQRQEILNLMEEHITENLVKIGADYYSQTVGIPQGSILSTILCAFFYGDLEKRHSMRFQADPGSLLLRLVDDYLFMTTNLSLAKEFLDMMNKGHPEYGCFISKDKTLTNFDYDAQIMSVTGPKQQGFPWCGFMINMQDLSITTDYTRYHGKPLSDSLTINRTRHPGSTFVHKMLWAARARSHPIYFDTSLNSSDVAYLNIFQNFTLCALKMHCYVRSWGVKPGRSSGLIADTVRKVLNAAYSAYRAKVMRLKASEGEEHQRLQKSAVFWLGTKAFYMVLSKNALRYGSVLRGLRTVLARPRSRGFERRFRKLVVEGSRDFDLVRP